MPRKLGSAQVGVLKAMTLYPNKGLTKSAMLGREWPVMDRLVELGLSKVQFVSGIGPVHFITEAGRAALAAAEVHA